MLWSVRWIWIVVVVMGMWMGSASMALPPPKPVMRLIHNINRHGPYLALVVPNAFEMNPLLHSSSFSPSTHFPLLDFAGRRFHIGSIEGHKVIVVMTGLAMLNAGLSTQLLLSFFKVKGVVHFGIAGNAEPSLHVGDVTIPHYWAHTGLWNWQRYGDDPNDELALEVNGDYTRDIGYLHLASFGPRASDNLLNNVWYQPEEVFPVNSTPEKAVVLLMQEPADRDAMIARDALEGWCTDDRALTEVICTRSSTEIVRIREAYLNRYQRYLEEDVACKTQGPFQKLLLALLKAHRCECKAVNMEQAKCDAKRLYEAGEGRCGTDEETIIQILSERSVAQLRATFACYKQEYGHDIMKALKKETHGEFEDALRVMIKSMYLPAHYFAKVLKRGMKGLLNDKSAIARVMVTRAEVDLKEINLVFERKYKMSLVQAFHKELSGHFKNFCLTLTVRAGIPQQLPQACGCN